MKYTVDNTNWVSYKNNQKFKGNVDTTATVSHKLEPFQAKAVRLYPTKWSPVGDWISMRFEVYYAQPVPLAKAIELGYPRTYSSKSSDCEDPSLVQNNANTCKGWQAATNNADEYHQVTLPGKKKVHKIITKGREDNA